MTRPARTAWPAQSRRCLFAACVAVAACDAKDSSKNDPPKTAKAPPSEKTPPPKPTSSSPTDLLAWLDPDAIAIVYAEFPPKLDLDAFGTVFALPPRVTRLLVDLKRFDHDLSAILPPKAKPPSEWLEPELLATQSRVNGHTYVLRRMSEDATSIEERLLATGMHKTTEQGMTVLTGHRVYPWRVVFLDERVLGFAPAQLGSSLGPLTAGRDLPASVAGTQLKQTLKSEPNVVLEVYAVGPLLHYDLDGELGQVLTRVRGWMPGMPPAMQDRLDVQVQLLPTSDPMDAVGTLRDRDVSLETDQIQTLAKRVQYSVEGPTIMGRLQLTRDDMKVLHGP